MAEILIQILSGVSKRKTHLYVRTHKKGPDIKKQTLFPLVPRQTVIFQSKIIIIIASNGILQRVKKV